MIHIFPPKERSFRTCVSHLFVYGCKIVFVDITWLIAQYIESLPVDTEARIIASEQEGQFTAIECMFLVKISLLFYYYNILYLYPISVLDANEVARYFSVRNTA